MDELPAFEVRELSDDGSLHSGVVLDRIPEADATAIAQDYADVWRSKTLLVSVPDVRGPDDDDWQQDDMRIIKELSPRTVTPAEYRIIKRRTMPWMTDEQFEIWEKKTGKMFG